MSSVIVLNANYEYWDEVSIRKVVRWLLKDKIQIVIAKEDETYNSISLKINMPVVVRLMNFVGYKIKNSKISYSDNRVFIRDNNICQYWHKDDMGNKFKYVCTEDERTIDHVTPKDKGGETSFDNCVCACKDCNTRIKKNKLPHEAGLELIRKPYTPQIRAGEFAVIKFVYNPRKLSHKYYMEKIIGKTFSHRA